jgi:hypothetical protein
MPSSGSLWLPPVLDFSSSSFAGRAERAGIFALMQRSLPLNLQVGRVIVQTQLGNTCYIRPMSALCNGFHVSLQQELSYVDLLVVSMCTRRHWTGSIHVWLLCG